MIDCNEWRTEKRHECANMGKVKRLESWWQLYCMSLPVWDFRPMDFCSTECTPSWWCHLTIIWRLESLFESSLSRSAREHSNKPIFTDMEKMHGNRCIVFITVFIKTHPFQQLFHVMFCKRTQILFFLKTFSTWNWCLFF